MPQIKRVWIVNAGMFQEKELEMLRQSAPGAEFDLAPFTMNMPDEKESITNGIALDTYDVIIGNPPADCLSRCQRLQLLQLVSAGTGGYPRAVQALPRSIALTNATGAYGPAISEHMLGMLLMLMKKLHLYRDHMRGGLWKDEGPVLSLNGARVLVIGMGDIGSCFARLCSACGAAVTGIRRTPGPCPDYAQAVYSTEELDVLLPQADVVAMSVPETPATFHLLSRERLALLQKNAIVLNVGRGNAIDTEALCDALLAGQLGGAGLDVTDPEPLPADHRLWQIPQALITPHVSGGNHLYGTVERIAAIAAENLQRLARGEQLINPVDLQTGYRRSTR
ncbi:MAG: D-2-hydroxyacid dehydrogenase [Provencibacterium sp.]|jgi:phosphoglycerate dehydrogenase-like enzyme|nr:D-2-hydroxyacid dehydrogenase [Provencibacterium sp.]